MPIVVSCPQCSRQLRLPTETLGQAVRCPLCHVIFLTHETEDGRAEAIPMAEPSEQAPPPPPPPVSKPGVPNLSLDETTDLPLEPLEPPGLSVPEEPLPPLRMVDDEDARLPRPAPRRRQRDEEDERPRPRRRVEEERPAPRRRRESSFKPVAFALRIGNDPNGRFDGRFNAAIDDEGLHIWRGRGRVIDVPVGASVKPLGGARLSVFLEGRDVEVIVIEPEGRSLALAEQMVAFFAGRQDRIELARPKPKKAGAVAWLMAVPIGIPLVAVLFGHSIGGVAGGILWGILALVLVGVCALFVLRASWSAAARAGWAGSAILVGYLILGCGFLFDRPGIPDSAWRNFRPDEGGFSVLMPGEPADAVAWASDQLRGRGIRMHEVRLPRAGLHFSAGLGEFQPEAVRGMSVMQRLDLARGILASSAPGTYVFREVNRGAGANMALKDYETRINNVRHGAARVTVQGRRVLILYVTSDSPITTHSPQLRRFFERGIIEPFDEAPDEPGPGPGPGNQPPPPPPPVVPNEDPGPNALTLARGQFFWAGFSKDGSTIAAVSTDRKYQVWDRNAQPRLEDTAPAPVPADILSVAALSPDGRWLALGYRQGALELIELKRGGERKTLSPRAQDRVFLLRAAFVPDGKTLVTMHSNGDVRLWDLARPGTSEKLPLEGRGVLSGLAVSPNSKLVAVSGTIDHRLRVFDLATKKEVGEGGGPNLVPMSVAFAADNRTLALFRSAEVRFWDSGTRQLRNTITFPQPWSAVALHPAGRLLAVGSTTGQVTIYHAESGEQRGILRDQAGRRLPVERIVALAFSDNGQQMVVCTAKRIELWQVERQVPVRPEDLVPLPSLPGNLTRMKVVVNNTALRLHSLSVCRNGSRFAAVPQQGTHIVLSNEATLKQQSTLSRGAAAPVLALSPTGDRAALSFPGTGTIDVFTTVDGNLKTALRPAGPAGDVLALAFSDDGRLLASAHRQPSGGLVRLWDANTGNEISTFTCRDAPQSVAFSPDALTLAVVAAQDKVVRLCEVATGREYAGLVGHSTGIRRVVFSPDGKWLASADFQGGVRLFDAKRCRRAFSFPGGGRGQDAVELAFSPDSTTLAVSSQAGFVRLYDVAAGKELLSLTQDGSVVGVGFGPGGNSLLVGSSESVNHWDLRDVAELKKRPPAAVIDLDKAPPPEVPDLQPAGRIEPHLCHVVDVKHGFVLAFTRDRLCLHYTYPELTFKGAWHTGAVIYRAALDAETGKLYAAVAVAGSLAPRDQGGWRGKGPVHVYDVKALQANKEGAGRLAAVTVVPGDTELHSLDVVGDWAVWVQSKPDQAQAKPTLGRFDTKMNKPAEPVELADLIFATRLSPDRKTLYLAGRLLANNGGFVRAIDLATFKAAGETEMDSVPIDLDASDDYLVLTTGGEIDFLDRKKDRWPAVMRWRGGFAQPMVRLAGGRAYILNRAGALVYGAYDLEPRGAERRNPQPTARFQGASDEPLEAEFTLTPDGKHLLNLSGQLLRVGQRELALPKARQEPPKEKGKDEAPPGKLKQTGLWKDAHTQRVLALAWSPRGQKLLSGGLDRRLVVRLVDSGKVERQQQATAAVCSLDWARSDRHFAAATWDDSCLLVALLNQASRHLRRAGPRAEVRGLAFSADTQSLIVAGDKDLAVWPIGGVAQPQTIAASKPLTGVAVAPGNNVTVAGGEDGQVRLFDLKEMKETVALKGHDGEVRCVAVSLDGKTAVSGGSDGKVKVWDVEEKKERHSFDQGAVVLAVALACDGKLIAAGGLDGSIKLWDATTGKEMADVPGLPTAPVCALAFSPDGKTLAVAASSAVRRYDTAALVGPAIKVDPPPGSEPVVPDSGKSAEIVTRLGTIRDAVFDVKGNQVLTLSSTGLLKRYRYPDFELTGSYRLERTAYRLFHDADKKALYEVKMVRPVADTEGRIRAEDAELIRFDIAELAPNKGKTIAQAQALTAGDRIKLEGTVGGAALALDGKSFFYLDTKANKLTKIDLAEKKAVKSVEVAKGAAAMCLTPDGKTLWVVSADSGVGKLQRFDIDLADKGSHDLDMAPAEVVATDSGRVCLSGTKGASKVVLLLDSTKEYRQLYQTTSNEATALALAGDQSVIYLSARNKAGKVVTIRVISATRDANAALPPLRVAGAVLGGDMLATPDAKFLLLTRTGMVIRLAKE